MRQLDDMPHQPMLIRIRHSLQRKIAVQLYRVRLQNADGGQIGIASSKIVQGNAHAKLTQIIPHLLDDEGIFQITAFRHFHNKTIRGMSLSCKAFSIVSTILLFNTWI